MAIWNFDRFVSARISLGCGRRFASGYAAGLYHGRVEAMQAGDLEHFQTAGMHAKALGKSVAAVPNGGHQLSYV